MSGAATQRPSPGTVRPLGEDGQMFAGVAGGGLFEGPAGDISEFDFDGKTAVGGVEEPRGDDISLGQDGHGGDVDRDRLRAHDGNGFGGPGGTGLALDMDAQNGHRAFGFAMPKGAGGQQQHEQQQGCGHEIKIESQAAKTHSAQHQIATSDESKDSYGKTIQQRRKT